jgi:DNA repair photolyase
MSRLWRAPGPLFGLHQLHAMRVGTVRVMGERMDGPQLDLLRRPPAQGAPDQPTRLPVLDERTRGTKFIRLPVRSVLNNPASTGMGFWSINPYVGCEFGCTFCYARDTHRWVVERAVGRMGGRAEVDVGGDGANDVSNIPPYRRTAVPTYRRSALPPEEAFEKEILVKSEVAEVLARTLNPARVAGHTLVIGTATDPYQPAERRFRLTRRILEVLRSYHGLSIGIITKSPLITRDLDLLQVLSQRHEVSVNISLATADRRLARRLELRSPIPEARLRALRRLTEGGVHAGLLVAPIIPGVTDDWAGLARLIEAAKEAGARYVVGSALRLGPAARHRFLPILEQEFPELAERYRRHYAGKVHVRQSYQDALTRRLRALQQAFGFSVEEGRRRRQQLEEPAPRKDAADSVQQAILL